jgi:hypothetical protein
MPNDDTHRMFQKELDVWNVSYFLVLMCRHPTMNSNAKGVVEQCGD